MGTTEAVATIPLSKEDMAFLAGGNWPLRFQKGQGYVEFQPAPGREETLNSLLVVESSFFVEMDNHGVNVHVFCYRETKDGPVLGFLWGQSSEDAFYGDDWFGERDLGPFLVNCKMVQTYEYARADGRRFLS